MPYIPTTWIDEVPTTTPIKYKITDDSAGVIADSAKIEVITPVTSGTPMTAVNLNKIEAQLVSLQTALDNILSVAFYVGCIYTAFTPDNPATKLGFGTWVAFGSGKVLVGVDTGQTEFNTVEKTGGEKTHVLTTGELSPHSHVERFSDMSTGTELYQNNLGSTNPSGYSLPATILNFLKWTNTTAKLSTSNTGGGAAHNNLQPYITVYFFKRTA